MSMTRAGGGAQRIWGCLRGGAVFYGFNQAVCCWAAETAAPTAAGGLSGATSLLSAIVKVFGSLLVVVGLMLVLLYFIKRTGLGSGRGRGSSAIAVLETRMVAPKKYVAIVEVAGKCLALGITDHNINLLADLGAEAKAALSPQAMGAKPGSTFAGLLSRSMKAWQAPVPESDGRAMENRNDHQESP